MQQKITKLSPVVILLLATNSKSAKKASSWLDQDHTLVTQLQGVREGKKEAFSSLIVGSGSFLTKRHVVRFSQT